MTTDLRKLKTNVYLRLCRDSGWSMDWTQAAALAADILECSALEIWAALGSIDNMKQVARGEHPICKSS